MSKDASHTYIHTHASHHADLFEEFCHSLSSSTSGSTANNQSGTSPQRRNHGGNANSNGTVGTGDPGMIHVSGHFLPFEEIHLPPHLMPLNPEDEDGVVPDMHAAFGIQRALHDESRGNGRAGEGTGGSGYVGQGNGRGAQQEPIWRDLGMERLMDSKDRRNGVAGARREGKKAGVLMIR